MTSESTVDGVWRPTRWREPPPTGDRPSWIPELAVVLVAALYNVAENLWVSGALAVPLGLAGTAIVLVIAISVLIIVLAFPRAAAAKPFTLNADGQLPQIPVDHSGTGHIVWNQQVIGGDEVTASSPT